MTVGALEIELPRLVSALELDEPLSLARVKRVGRLDFVPRPPVDNLAARCAGQKRHPLNLLSELLDQTWIKAARARGKLSEAGGEFHSLRPRNLGHRPVWLSPQDGLNDRAVAMTMERLDVSPLDAARAAGRLRSP